MNRTSKNYAQAAAQQTKNKQAHTNNPHHQHHHQQKQASGSSTSSNFSSSANGKPINNSQTKPQSQHNSTMGNGNTSHSAPIKQKNPVQLPTNGHAWESEPTSLIFGSIKTPNAQISSLPSSTGQTIKSGGGLPTTLPTKGVPTFGSLPTNNTITTPTTQATQATPTTVGTSGPGVNNSNNNNNNNSNGASKTISAHIPPRTHSAPPQFQDSNNKNISQSGHTPNVGPSRSQPNNVQSAPVVVNNNSPLNNRKDSVSSTVSSNDGQSTFHPHHSSHHPSSHPNHNQHHSHYRQQHSHHHSHKSSNVVQNMNMYTQRPRDKSVQHPSPGHLNPAQQPVPTQQGGIPLTPMFHHQVYNREYPPHMYYPGYPVPPPNPMFMSYVPQQRPPQMSQPHIPQVTNNFSKPPPKKSNAIEIIDPSKNAPIQIPNINNIQQQQLSKNSNFKREEAPPAVSDKKLEEPDKERPNSAVPIVDPEKKEKEERLAKEKEEQERKDREEREERERKEKEEQERKEREERERKEREEQERKEREEQERKEREERERREREEQERKEREERERKEREEQERKEREERERREREEQERKEREERERKEREEQERKEREERERKEQEERERKEREERERIEREERERKEREERERKEREERERKEREEQERKEKEEQERKEREERERKERKEREEKERIAKEEKERKEKEERARLEAEKLRKEEEEKALKEQEKERQEVERKKKEEEESKTKVAAEEAEKKKEAETSDKKEEKKEEKKFNKGHRPGPLDLSRTTSAPAIPSAPLSALGSARIIDDLNSVQYPPHIKSPNPELNSNAEPGKFKYDRNFLMQFMTVCKEKPENLPALEAIGMEEPKDDKKNRPGSRANTGSRGTAHKNSPNQTQFQMGEFKFPPKTSEERFAISMSSMRNGTPLSSFGKLGRTASGSALLPTPAMSSTANPPSPGRPSNIRRDSSRRGAKGAHQMQGQNVGQEHVAPLERSENRWVPQIFSTSPKSNDDIIIPIDSVQRKVKALLNKLTLEKFDSISDQIIDYANKSRDERDGRILKEVIRLIFEKSCDESNFCAMYAQLCRKMMEKVDPEIVDENVKNTEGKFVQGGTLFRKYLLNRCQEEFEKGWKVNIPVPSNEKGEPDLMSDEYYAAAKAKRQGLGLIRFIGELFKLNMLTERIMHECIKKLLIFQGLPEEEEMESLCKLMNTVGEQLDHIKPNQHEQLKSTQIDHAKAKKYMETYFERMDEISKSPNLSSRIKFMLMDVIDLRSNNWKPRRDINAPKTIAEIHEDAAKQKEEAEYLRRSTSSGGRGMPKMAEQMSRSGSGRRENRSDKGMAPSISSDGWSTVGGSSSQRNKDKVGDLTKFGSVNRSKIGNVVSLSPGGILGSLSGGAKGWSKNDNKDRDDKPTGLTRTNSTTNIYSVLNSDSSEGRKSSESVSSETQKPSPPTERKKLILTPRTKGITPEEPQVATKSKSTPESASSVQSMPEELAIKRIDNMTEEYFSVWDIREVTLCLKEIPAEYHPKAIESFANKVIEKKPKDVDNVMKLFKEIVSSKTCDTDTFKDGFKATLEFLIDIGADAPMAYSFTGQLLFSAELDFRDIAKLLKPLDDDSAIEKIVKGYTSALKNGVDEQTYVQKINEQKKSKDDININKYIEDLGGSSKK